MHTWSIDQPCTVHLHNQLNKLMLMRKVFHYISCHFHIISFMITVCSGHDILTHFRPFKIIFFSSVCINSSLFFPFYINTPLATSDRFYKWVTESFIKPINLKHWFIQELNSLLLLVALRQFGIILIGQSKWQLIVYWSVVENQYHTPKHAVVNSYCVFMLERYCYCLHWHCCHLGKQVH